MAVVEETVETSPLSLRERVVSRVGAYRIDLVVLGGYFAVTLALTSQLWRDPNGRVVGVNRSDQVFFEFVLARAARAITHFENPMFTTAMNPPSGVNLMANTSVLGFSIPLTPVTLLFGPSVSFVLMTIIAFTATATAWYVVLSRLIVRSKIAAALGGAFCAFAPAMVSQANAHPNLVAQFMVPLIVWRVAVLGASRRLVRDGVILGLLITYQAFINEEILFLTAQALVVCTVVYLLSGRRAALEQWRPYIKGIAIAGVVALVLLAYPLYFQFLGPQHYRGLPVSISHRYGIDAAAYVSFPPETIFGQYEAAAKLVPGSAERNAFFGWPLVLFLIFVTVWQWRHLAVRLAAAVAAYFVVLSLGVRIMAYTHSTGVPGPWRWLVKAPLFDTVVPARFGLGATAAAGVLLALGVDAVIRIGSGRRAAILRTAGALVVAAALIPLTPHRITTVAEHPVPQFFADGTWREYLPPGKSVFMGNTTRTGEIDGMRWSAATGQDFAVARGYFLGPNVNSPKKIAGFGSPVSETTLLLAKVASTGVVPKIDDTNRRQALIDLGAAEAGLVVVPDGRSYEDALHETLDSLLQQKGELVGGVWVWRVQP